MKPFEFVRTEDSQEAFNEMSSSSKLIAGGTNLLDLMKKHISQPDKLVDVTTALDNTIGQTSKGLRIGAMVRNSTLASHPLIIHQYPLLAKAVLKGASPQIRNMASTAGNLMQRTRCPYFYDTSLPCNKRKNGSGCGAKDGNNRTAAIVGYSDSCVAVHPSDMCVALAALDAEVEIIQNGTEKVSIPFADFHRLPGDNPEQDNNLPENAIITGIHIPNNKFFRNNTYLKLRDRDEYAFALVSVAAAFEMRGKKIRRARLASGGVAHKPWRWYEAEDYLRKKKPGKEIFAKAAEIVISETKPLKHNEFKIQMLKGAIETALFDCLTGVNKNYESIF